MAIILTKTNKRWKNSDKDRHIFAFMFIVHIPIIRGKK